MSAAGSAAGLSGVRVLDFSSGICGPYATKLLADAGADVVKVETAQGDPMRSWSSTQAVGAAGAGEAGDTAGNDGDRKALFCYLNTSKRSVVGKPHDEHICKLLEAADVVVEDFPPSVSKEIDFAGRYPHLVVCSITPYGRQGPLADAPWTEFTVQAECGSTSVRGRPDQPPIHAGGRITEYIAGAYAAPAIVAALALVRQQPSPQGHHLDFSIAEAGIISLGVYSEVAQQLQKDGSWGGGSRSVELPSIEPTKDGWVGFNTNTGQQAENFLILIERFDLLESGEWTGPASAGKRMANIDLWNSYVHEWTTKHTTAEIVERAVELRIPVAPVHSGESVFGEEHFIDRGVFVENPDGFKQPRPAYLLTGSGSGGSAADTGESVANAAGNLGLPVVMQPAPKLGEHQAEVWSDWGATSSRVSQSARSIFGVGDFAQEANFTKLVEGASHAQDPAAVGPPEGSLPFAGFRIVDLTSWWAGPSATQLFALLGAEVIHIESASHPDGMRMTGAMFGQPEWWEWSHLVMSANTNKLGLTLDLETPEGLELLARLAAKSDAVVENFSPRVAEKFGLSFEFLRSLNRRIVFMRMPAFGLSGPWRERVGFAQTMEQVTGMAWLTGHEYDQPRIIRGPCDPIAGMHGAFALMLGLMERHRTDDAVFVESTMVEAALNCAAEAMVEFSATGGVMERMGNRSPYAAPQNLYECRETDTWLALAVQDDTQWEGLKAALGHPAWAESVELDSCQGRRAGHDVLDEHLQAWASEQDSEEAAQHLRSFGVPAAVVYNTRLLAQHPQFTARGFYEEMEHPLAGRALLPTLPYSLSEQWIKRAAPMMGQDNTTILGGLLGLSSEELADLEEKGVVASRPKGM